MTPPDREALISELEQKAGLRLAPGFRAAMVQDGQCALRIKEYGPGPKAVALAASLVEDSVEGWTAFADEAGNPLRLGGWVPLPDLGLAEPYTAIAEFGTGDYLILACDGTETAKRVLFMDHETGELPEQAADIDAVLVTA